MACCHAGYLPRSITLSNTMTPLMPINQSPRLMLEGDLDAVISLQTTCYGPEFHEPKASFASKLLAAPDSCWVLQGPSGLLAYLVCLPIERDRLPALHSPDWRSSPAPDWLYLHDLAIHPDARGAGLAKLMLLRATELAQTLGLPSMGLIAVQGSVPFWGRHGFEPILDKGSQISEAKLASFGEGATFMLRRTITS